MVAPDDESLFQNWQPFSHNILDSLYTAASQAIAKEEENPTLELVENLSDSANCHFQVPIAMKVEVLDFGNCQYSSIDHVT